MAEATQWIIRGRIATRRDLMEAMALARQHRAKIAQADREARDRDAAARSVAASIRRQTDKTIGCRPRHIKVNLGGERQLSRLEARFGLAMIKRAAGSGGGVSSFHFKLTPRGLGAPRRAGGRRYRRGEIVAALSYILRLSAREDNDQGIESNISINPDRLATVLGALEQLEIDAGRDNANVYMSLIVSLPAELNGVERKDLLGHICDYLAEHGLGYVGIQHKPDRDGDQRNYHAHILFSWRPMAVTPDCCAFSADTLGALNTPEFVTAFRAHAADAMNVAMNAAGHARRFTPERTRTGPGSSVADKHGAGRKHRDRRSGRITLAEQARTAWRERASAITAAISAVERWATNIIPDRSGTMADLRERQDPILSAIADRQAQSAAVAAVGVTPSGLPVEAAVSHAKPVDVETRPTLAESSHTPLITPARAPLQPVSPELLPSRATPDAVIPVVTKETEHANRPVDAAHLLAVRRRFATREPDHRRAGGQIDVGSLASVPGLSTLGLAGGGVEGAEMLLHGLPPGLLGNAARRMGSGDGVRRPRAGDPGTERAEDGIKPTDRVAGSTAADLAPASKTPLPRFKTKRSGSPVADRIRQHIKNRGEELGVAPEPVAVHAAERADVQNKPPTPSIPKASTVPAVNSGRPAERATSPPPANRSASKKRPTDVEAKRASAVKPNKVSKVPPASVHRERDVDLESLANKLAMRTLPLRQVTTQSQGRERTMVVLIAEKAVPEDAALVSLAVKHQTERVIQELFERMFEALLAHARDTLSAISDKSERARLTMLNPKDKPRLRAALEAAMGSPSFDAIINPVDPASLDEGSSEIGRFIYRASGGHGHGD